MLDIVRPLASLLLCYGCCRVTASSAPWLSCTQRTDASARVGMMGRAGLSSNWGSTPEWKKAASWIAQQQQQPASIIGVRSYPVLYRPSIPLVHQSNSIKPCFLPRCLREVTRDATRWLVRTGTGAGVFSSDSHARRLRLR
jgi:hypothetical protein